MSDKEQIVKHAGKPADPRQERLAKALRQNLLRRKASQTDDKKG